MSALKADLYEFTMAAGYFASGKADQVATFELSIRRLPEGRNYLLAAGLAQAVEYLLSLRFLADDIAFLQTLPQFHNASAEFFDYLLQLRFTGDLFAVPEGTPVFANEPLAIIRAPLIQAQLVETYLLSTFAFQTSIASKAARCVTAADGRPVVEFGSRRAHGPDAGVLAARAAFIGGCSGTSNVESGKRFGIPLSGTAAHSWTMAFSDEKQSFVALQKLLGQNTVFLIDTYDTLAGARLVADVGQPLWGVRLDSGDLVPLSRHVRETLDHAGLQSAKIFASNDLDEHRLSELIRAGAAIDAFGIGTQLATSADAPSLSAIYKLVELRTGSELKYTAKFSDEKATRPGAKQIYRFADHDLLALQTECSSDFGSRPLLQPVISQGELLDALPSVVQARSCAAESLAALPGALLSIDRPVPYEVRVSTRLSELTESIRHQHQS